MLYLRPFIDAKSLNTMLSSFGKYLLIWTLCFWMWTTEVIGLWTNELFYAVYPLIKYFKWVLMMVFYLQRESGDSLTAGILQHAVSIWENMNNVKLYTKPVPGGPLSCRVHTWTKLMKVFRNFQTSVLELNSAGRWPSSAGLDTYAVIWHIVAFIESNVLGTDNSTCNNSGTDLVEQTSL